ncbi:DUF5977 domain-containing protein [Pedobacter terrae]|uniref:DUF5977 domain-containing protein n=1 Tax=Pedobacter terrae TaxID=405671 RepID=UPI002FFD01E7
MRLFLFNATNNLYEPSTRLINLTIILDRIKRPIGRLLALLFWLIWCTAINSIAQEVPKVILPSPETAALFRFQNYPVDHSTGLPQINVPIYEIKSGSLSVPIGLSYHASGRRVYDQDGAIALGWNLNAGGTISRTVYGSVDFGGYPFPSPLVTPTLSNRNDYLHFEKITHFKNNTDDVGVGDWKDSEYDIFSYYFGNNSGNFLFKDNNGVKTPTLMPYKPYIVTPIYNSTSLTAINILDDKGIFYEFNARGSYSDNLGFTVNNEYSLSRIISADKADTISFVYGKGFNQKRQTINQTITLIDKFTGPPSTAPETKVERENTNTDYYQLNRLTEIIFRYGKVVFNLVSNSDKIENIQVFNKENILIKTIEIKRSDLDGASEIGNYTSKLDNIVFKDNVGNSIENYAFEYYPTYNYTSNTFNVRSSDWWGYYNGSGQQNMIPQYNNLEYVGPSSINFNYSVGSVATNRNPNLSGLTSGVLKKISYPTGGSSEFIYEKNLYKHYSDNTIKDGPGLRIYQIKNNDNNGTLSYKTYTYGEDESGYGSIDMVPIMNNMASESYYYYLPASDPQSPFGFGINSYRERTFYSDFIPSLKDLASRPVNYTTVTEYLGTPLDNIGKTVYTYDYSGWAPSNLQVNRGLTINRQHIYDYNYWNKPSLLTQKEYKIISNQGLPYQLRKMIANSYSTTTTEYVSGLHVERINNFPQAGRVSDPTPPALYPEPWAVIRGSEGMEVPYGFGEYRIPIGYKNLTGSAEINYHKNGASDTTSTGYGYNSHQYINLSTVRTSDKKEINTQLTYPFDYQNDAVLTQMADPSLNMLNFPVEKIQSKNNVIVNGTKTKYFNWGSNFPRIYPQAIEAKSGSLPYETRVRFFNYDDKGNILSMSREYGAKENYIWSYHNQYPIAKIENADYNSIVALLGGSSVVNAFAKINPTNAALNTFLSPLFTATEMKNSLVTTYTYKPFFGLTSSTDSKGMTTSYNYDGYLRLINVKDQNDHILKNFKYSYTDGVASTTLFFNQYLSGSYTKNNCTTGYGTSLTYRVPAKKYSSNISQADADAKAQADLNANGQNFVNANGTCFFKNQAKEQLFTKNNCNAGVNGTSVLYSVIAGKYTSIISQEDADAQALNEIALNGQANANAKGGCGFNNVEKGGYFTKNNCPANSIPSQLYYKVPASTYYSAISQEEADNLAQNDILANGQNYANANGVCVPAVQVSFHNSTSDSFGISFSTSSGYYKSYVCPPGNSSLTLPGGIYSVSISVINSSNSRRMYVGSRSAIEGTYANFSNVNISNGTGSQYENSIGMY